MDSQQALVVALLDITALVELPAPPLHYLILLDHVMLATIAQSIQPDQLHALGGLTHLLNLTKLSLIVCLVHQVLIVILQVFPLQQDSVMLVGTVLIAAVKLDQLVAVAVAVETRV